eukprot:363306-Chlamydomonas_euryale.AAC.2
MYRPATTERHVRRLAALRAAPLSAPRGSVWRRFPHRAALRVAATQPGQGTVPSQGCRTPASPSMPSGPGGRHASRPSVRCWSPARKHPSARCWSPARSRPSAYSRPPTHSRPSANSLRMRGTAESSPATSSMPGSSGSAMLNSVAENASTASLASGIPMPTRYRASASLGCTAPLYVSLSVITTNTSTGMRCRSA